VLEALVGFELKRERSVLAKVGQEIVQLVNKGEGCIHSHLMAQPS
jgi:hypothetical protein